MQGIEQKFGIYSLLASENVHAQLCPTLCDLRDGSLPGFSVHGIFQARILGGLPFPSPGDLPDPGIEPVSLVSQCMYCFFKAMRHPFTHYLQLEA